MEEDSEKNELSINDRIDAIEEEYEKDIKGMRIKYIFIMILLVLVTFVLASEFTINYYGLNLISKAEVSEDETENIEQIAETLKSFRQAIDEYYLGDIDETNMMEETLKGYINGLGDEYSEYFTADEWEQFQASALGNYVGIGIYMSQDKNGNVVVVSPIEGTPAEEAGILSGDIFYEIDGENVVGKTSEEIANIVRGEAGTKVKLTLYRDGEYKEFEVERKEIKVYHVSSKMLENNVGYIKLDTFDDGCAAEVKDALVSLQDQGATKIVFDLRNNTGGLLNEALDIADLFMDEDKITLITKDKDGNEDVSKTSTPATLKSGVEVVLLVNEYSASASEILTGALKDNGVTKAVVGTKTYGKGVIQSVFSLKDGSALKLTINEYFTPNENKINKVGITPDYEVELDDAQDGDEQLNKALEILNNN